ncbi:hypothetical protein EHQ81_13555 [Leptospira selangorensis]|uniref:Uncharacterized protein n=1 Tax=Leptospira selangorensis TaxID=2484982 RepID=A0A5F2BXS0_9LEPT|nr:hypothetical protein [Leptospira selangorensis]TGM12098.1 hypothetical protein EHQ81_13555 [Leptospira selangorensis]TGM14859.1 hypothetical protein EHQ82_19055 [Leptospira selangorensis]
MTLCAAWIRDTGDSEELIFCTDSTLTGGEKWNHGVKLFELPRKDCLICFAGETYRAYPLILNLISALKHDRKLNNSMLDIHDVLNRVADNFTELVNSIFDLPFGNNENIGSEAKFLFGGWSWKDSKFRVWRLDYNVGIGAFIETEEFLGKIGKVAFIGDPDGDNLGTNIPEIALAKLKEIRTNSDSFDGKLGMEPMEVVVKMCRDSGVREVDGALQIGKIYKSGTNEFFGIRWPSVINGKHTFLGKNYDIFTRPTVKYFDPDSCEILEEELPTKLPMLEDFEKSEGFEFILDAYSGEENGLRSNLSEPERNRLISIFKEYSYKKFLDNLTESQNGEYD